MSCSDCTPLIAAVIEIEEAPPNQKGRAIRAALKLARKLEGEDGRGE